MKNFIKENKLLIITTVLYLIVFFLNPGLFYNAVKMTGKFLLEMIEVMPPILLLSALITVWVPSEVITKNFGRKSGFKGKLVSVLIGSVSAGPIYAAFPMAQTLFYKGASVSNIVIIISAWAVVKIPMFMIESSFLGMKFAATRYLLTVPAIIALGYIMDKIVKREDILEEQKQLEKKTEVTEKFILQQLPRFDCGGCGYKDCAAFAKAVYAGKALISGCVVKNKNKEKEEEYVSV
ncbi:permease [Kosmotoga pacifica]|uniref:Fe-S cluster protein n=1 Tax=Kosmotoga pacifica TaxID=1330330 RepID=A0A0G2ZB83_9BACT|nr:permease [Kosmotoga pacifica]AKI97346.1 Fe-S cluster protein [Kosmotoga pacifica]